MPAVTRVSGMPSACGRGQLTSKTALHHFVVALLVGRYEDDLSAEVLVDALQELQGIWPAAPLLGVPEDHAIGLNVLVDETTDRRPECLFLVRPDPDEEPKQHQ